MKFLKENGLRLYLFCILIGSLVQTSYSQLDGRRNTIKINLSNPVIFGSSAFIFGYERVIGRNQSVSIGIGRMSLPKFATGSGGDSISLQKNSGDQGFNISIDYRFYLKGENKFDAPRGIYIGPYYSYNHFSRSNDWLVNTSSLNGNVNTKLDFAINTIGAELGYQFVLWKRLAIDLVMIGPGVGFYQIDAGLKTNMDEGDKELLFQQLNNYLKNKIPGYSLVIGDGDLKRSGSVKTTTFGYRYMVNLGFRF